MVLQGMRALNYSLLLLDDCWSATNRSITGELQPDPARFPSGIPSLVAYLKPRGFGLGLCKCRRPRNEPRPQAQP